MAGKDDEQEVSRWRRYCHQRFNLLDDLVGKLGLDAETCE